MPYIDDAAKDDINGTPLGVAFYPPEQQTPGKLTYALFRLCHNYLGSAPSFADFATVLGSLEAAKLEIYRRKVAPYEDKKIKENGDVR